MSSMRRSLMLYIQSFCWGTYQAYSGHLLSPGVTAPHLVLSWNHLVKYALDLSQPRGTSVNEFILEKFCSVHYSVFDDAVKVARLAGESAMMAKIDIKHAFRLCPVKIDFSVSNGKTCILWTHIYLLGAEHLQQYSIHLLMPWLGFFSVGVSITLCIIWMIFSCVHPMLCALSGWPFSRPFSRILGYLFPTRRR